MHANSMKKVQSNAFIRLQLPSNPSLGASFMPCLMRGNHGVSDANDWQLAAYSGSK